MKTVSLSGIPLAIPVDSAAQEPRTSLESGLTLEEVRNRIREFGYNEIPEEKGSPVWRFVSKFWGVTPWMLEITIGLEWLLGKYLEMAVIVGLLVFNAILGFLQEERANSALDLLKEKLRIKTRVRRDGKWTAVSSRDLVPGDVVRLRAGDFVPADVRAEEGNAEVDQSSLTGESQLAEKKAREVLYSGSVVRRGEVTGTVTATGAKTYFGRTVELVQVARPKLHMEEVTSKVVKRLLLIVSSFLAMALVVTAVKGMNLLDVLPLSVVLMVSAIPVALPTMFTITMALGSLELMKKGVLVTRLSAVEDAATMNIVCADKTGTMTMNRLSIEKVAGYGPHSERDVIAYGTLASNEADQDPIDMAFISAAKRLQIPMNGSRVKRFIPFDPSTRKTEATVEEEGRELTVTKGALNAILSLCKKEQSGWAEIEKEVGNLSQRGYRAIAVARGIPGGSAELVGIAFLYDKLREDSPRLIRELADLGVKTKMLTGDALPIAREVAEELELGTAVVTIKDLKKDNEDRISKLAEDSSGFAEIYPEDKYLIVKGLQKAGHVVGMTGDGVNDAPALRQSEVGIAVSSATDVAKKAASAVLTSEGLEGIVDLVKIGRMTYQRVITWILNKILKTFQITVFVVLAFLLTGTYVISALHMILLLFLTDFVTLSISTDRVRHSRKPDTWKIQGLVKVALSLGILVIAELTLVLFGIGSYFDLFGKTGQLQTFTFQMLIYVELLDLLLLRERGHFWNSRPSRFVLFAIVSDLVMVFLISVLGFPGIVPIRLAVALTVAGLSGFIVFLMNDPVKVFLVNRFWTGS